ncbi:MAG: amidinotransferase [Planctomycetes bacterium]|nr:amidinotransferase [Planctomycetota bacterium]
MPLSSDPAPSPLQAEARSCHHVMMVRPDHFGWNAETAASNCFQSTPKEAPEGEVHEAALKEFDALGQALTGAGIQVHCFQDPPHPATPDAIFPNNWVSFHGDGTLILYPMQATNRRAEVRTDWIDSLEETLGCRWQRRIDLRPLAEREEFLEGTGSLVLDRRERVAYAALSPRTTPEGLAAFAVATGYSVETFQTQDRGHPIYHTNVMMALGSQHAMVCLDAMPVKSERDRLRLGLETSGFEIVEFDRQQLTRFVGNQITLLDEGGNPHIITSSRALASLSPSQVKHLERFGNIIAPSLDTIEFHGGGSARCILAEIALPANHPAI